MTWEIFLGIVAMVTFIGTIGLWISKLSTVIATLSTTINLLKQTLENFEKRSHETHNALFNKMHELEQIVSNHEARIFAIEHQESE